MSLQVDVIIPTVDRKALLMEALKGVLCQDTEGLNVSVVVVDNSSDARQKSVFDSIATGARLSMFYMHEPERGLAAARNRGIADTRGDFVIFLDDDEKPADTRWLSTLVATITRQGADAAFGAVQPLFEIHPSRHLRFVTALYSRRLSSLDGEDVTRWVDALGTGNSCFRRETCFEPGVSPFDRAYDATGGEDVDLLYRLRQQNRRFVWAGNAIVNEFVPRARLEPEYLASRRFRQGQQRTSLQLVRGKRARYDKLAVWMCVGAFQASYHLAAGLGAKMIGAHEQSELEMIQFWGGAGKILWQQRLRQDSYGMQR